MGLWVDTILDREVDTLEQAQEAAARIVAWLVDRRIVEDRQCKGCVGDGPCYAAGPNIRQVGQSASGDTTASDTETYHAAMRVVTGREFMFALSGSFDKIACPRCCKEVDWAAYFDAGSAWLEGGPDSMTCPDCGASSRLREWEHAESGFVMLGFEFFGCPEFSPDFIAEFSRRLGHRITYYNEKR